jgi:hypothetical protein
MEDLSPRAKRLVESGVIDLTTIVGSGEDGRITSGDILERARLMEKEQSVARIETIEPATGDDAPTEDAPTDDAPTEDAPTEDAAAPPGAEVAAIPEVTAIPEIRPIRDDESTTEPMAGEPDIDAALHVPEQEEVEPVMSPSEPPVGVAFVAVDKSIVPPAEPETSTSAAYLGGEPIKVPPNPWDAYNGSTDGLAESALPGAEQSWGEAEANIAAIAEEAAAQLYRRPETALEPTAFDPDPVFAAGPVESVEESDTADVDVVDALAEDGSSVVEGDVSETDLGPLQPEPTTIEEPAGVVASSAEAQAVVDETIAESETPEQPEQHAEVMMDFGTLEQVDPESVWAGGAEDFAPWFLANSKQLGDVLGLNTGLSEPRQYTTRSATGVIGRDDNGEEVVVVSSQHAAADDSDLGRALGMAASSGAATVALVSARFGEEQLQALEWLNSQTKSGVKWFGIEMKVVRIADSPPAMMFNLVAAPPAG